VDVDFDRKESADTLKPAMQSSQEPKSFRAKDAGIVAFNDADKYKL
jgi:hypothetical protein